jgi:charged multivesicular body protein 6
MDVVEGLKVGNESLKQLHALMSIDNIEALLDETREGVEKQREIDELLGGSFSTEDEADLMAELEQLTAEPETEDNQLELPDVPTTDLVSEPVSAKAKPEARKERKEAVLAS